MNKKYTKIISTSNPVQWYSFQNIKAKNTITLLSNINVFTEQLFSCLLCLNTTMSRRFDMSF